MLLDVSNAVINQNFNATCVATGYPAPELSITLDCHGTLTRFDQVIIYRTGNYTMKKLILINEFPSTCSAISCYSYPVQCHETINRTSVSIIYPSSVVPATTTTTTTTTTITAISVTPSGTSGAASRTVDTIIILFTVSILLS